MLCLLKSSATGGDRCVVGVNQLSGGRLLASLQGAGVIGGCEARRLAARMASGAEVSSPNTVDIVGE